MRIDWVKGADGRMAMGEVEGSRFELKADLVLLAMGFLGPRKPGMVEQAGVALDPRGNVAANVKDYKTSRAQAVRRRRHAARPVAGRLGDPRGPPMRALDRREPDGVDDPAALILYRGYLPGDAFVLCFIDNAAGPRDGNGERTVMAANKKNMEKKSPEKANPEKKNNDKKILAFVERCDNAGELETLIKNATKLGNAPVAEAAFRKRISLVPAEQPGSVEHDFWQTVQAFEHALSEERGKTTRLFRTRQKVAKVRRRADASRMGARRPGDRGFQDAARTRHAGVHRRGDHIAPSRAVRGACPRGGAAEAAGGGRRLDVAALDTGGFDQRQIERHREAAEAAIGMIAGFGVDSDVLALEAMVARLRKKA